ncbi:helix-turn-helix transcriptional regulator [Parafrankia sp. BMG5.11]|uniref:helix-turn-helix transcriptional regulator n=1 Tax=Parafrankia sp. BMG5.11 TaxID=222540 RepID=UPI00104000C2|nr:helix-turn-helix transcriptional regulator [Parafrankia sp. BMG5.11]TCJ41208.1 helix-turn-helix transcriptional regulator [Parafrankia sp. BMG5.11]
MQGALGRKIAPAVGRDFELQFEKMLGALDARPRLVLDRDCGLVWCSDNATRLLVPPFPLHIENGALAVDDPSANAALADFVEAASGSCDSVLLRGRNTRHWAMVIGWSLPDDTDLVCLLMNLSIPHRGVQDSGLARALRLTATETRVLDHFARLYSPREIAQQMAISLSTVRSHLKQIHSKAGVESAVQLTQLVRGFCAC